MYPGDARSKWPATLLTDGRVTHFWDEQRVIGRTYLSRLPLVLDRRAPNTMMPEADALWDAFFVYARDAGWQDAVPPPVTWGYPIMPTRDTLASTVDALLQRQQER